VLVAELVAAAALLDAVVAAVVALDDAEPLLLLLALLPLPQAAPTIDAVTARRIRAARGPGKRPCLSTALNMVSLLIVSVNTTCSSWRS
jgi:hypothetical protein